jgi:hypothetical protein
MKKSLKTSDTFAGSFIISLITDDLNFKPVSSDFVSKQINKLNIKKAAGYDGISPKILKLSMPCIVSLAKHLLDDNFLSLKYYSS